MTWESDGTNTLYYYYNGAGDLFGLKHNGTHYYYVKNAQGDIIRILDASGTVVVEYIYDTWGKLIDINGSLKDTIGIFNPYRYRSYRYDTETGFYYLNSRYYDPEVGRFINADSLVDNRGVGTQNLFVYCGNNPVNFDDSEGHLPGLGIAVGALVGGIIGGVMGGLTAAANGKSVAAGIATGAASGAAIGVLVGGLVDPLGATAAIAIKVLGSGAIAAAGNVANQGMNYNAERKAQSSQSLNNINVPKSSSGKTASECESFADYVSYKEIGIAAVAGMVAAPLGIGANWIVNSAVPAAMSSGAVNIGAKVIASLATSGNVSILQSVISLF